MLQVSNGSLVLFVEMFHCFFNSIESDSINTSLSGLFAILSMENKSMN